MAELISTVSAARPPPHPPAYEQREPPPPQPQPQPRPERRPYSREGLSELSKTIPILPPLAYDFPYTGKLTVRRVDPDQMRARRPLPKPGRATIGCAHIAKGECEVIIADNTTLEFLGFNYDIVLRHELAHCNGWPGDHPGAETA
jgi:hypothetical protein